MECLSLNGELVCRVRDKEDFSLPGDVYTALSHLRSKS